MSAIVDFGEDPVIASRMVLIQDFRETHSQCQIVFTTQDRLDFIEGRTFIAWGQEWEAVSYKEVDRDTEYYYAVLGYPVGVCSVIDRKFTNLSSLANAVGVGLEGNSTDFAIPFPMHNICLSPLLYKLRYESLERNLAHPEQSWFLFYDDRGLISKTYKGVSRGTVLEYDMDVLRSTGGHYYFVRDGLKVRYNQDHHPAKLSYKNYIGSLVGDKYDVKSIVPALIGERYKLTGSNQDKFLDHDKLVLVRQKYDSAKNPLPWSLTFGQLKIG